MEREGEKRVRMGRGSVRKREKGMCVCVSVKKPRGGNLLVMRTKLFLPSSLERERNIYIYVYMYQTAKSKKKEEGGGEGGVWNLCEESSYVGIRIIPPANKIHLGTDIGIKKTLHSNL